MFFVSSVTGSLNSRIDALLLPYCLSSMTVAKVSELLNLDVPLRILWAMKGSPFMQSLNSNPKS